MNVTALVTAYHPDDRLAAVVESALLTCSGVIVSDNTPASSTSSAESNRRGRGSSDAASVCWRSVSA